MSKQLLLKSFQTNLSEIEQKRSRKYGPLPTSQIFADWLKENDYWQESFLRRQLTRLSRFRWPKYLYANWCIENGQRDRGIVICRELDQPNIPSHRFAASGYASNVNFATANWKHFRTGEERINHESIKADLQRQPIRSFYLGRISYWFTLYAEATFITAVENLPFNNWKTGWEIVRFHPIKKLSLNFGGAPFLARENDGTLTLRLQQLPPPVLNVIAARNIQTTKLQGALEVFETLSRACLWAARQSRARWEQLGFHK